MINQRSTPFGDYLSILPLIFGGLILFALLVSANWPLANRYGTGAEFLPAWNGSRAFLFEKIDPYTQTVAERTQIVVYGRAARAGEFPYLLDIPFPLLILYLPFALIPDATWARAAFMALSEIGLLALILLTLRLLEWQPRLWFTILFCVLAFASLFGISAILEGSPAILIVLAVVGAMQAMRSESDEVAGILLALASFHWQTMILLWLMVAIGAYRARRWRVFVGYVMLWVVLGGITYIIFMSSPGWILPYLRGVAFNLRADANLSFVHFLAQGVPASAEKYLPIIPATLILLLMFEWVGAMRGTDSRRFMWAAALSLAITPLVGSSTFFSNLAPLVFSILCILPFARERWRRFSYPAIFVFILTLFVLPYYILWRFSADQFIANGLAYLTPTALTIFGLYWVRWYALRPPLTWADEVKLGLRM